MAWLANPRLMALAALGVSVALFGLCRGFLPQGVWWVAILQSGAAAGIVGGLTDWFAVTAIFRGWPGPGRFALPSTNILIRRRRQIEEALLNLITGRVLGPEALREYFLAEPPLTALIQGLRRPGTGAERILGHLLGKLAGQVPVEEVAQHLAGILGEARVPQGMGEQTAGLLRYLAREERLDRLLQWCLLHLRSLCGQPAMRALVAAALHETLEAYQRRGLFKGLAVRFARGHLMSDLDRTAGEILEAAAREISNARHNVSDTRGFRARRRLVHWLVGQLEALAGDPVRLEAHVAALMARLANAETVTPQLEDLLRRLLGQLGDESTGWAERGAGRVLQWVADSPRGGALDREIGNGLADWIQRADLRTRFRTTLEGYGDEELARVTREYVAKDLQWIRVSGTVIGFLVGTGLGILVELANWLQGG